MSGRWISVVTVLSLAALLALGLWAAAGATAGLGSGAQTAPSAPQLGRTTAAAVPGIVALPDAEERAVRGPHPRPVAKSARTAAAIVSERERMAVSLASRGLTSRVVHVSWYGAEFQGLGTASGELFDRYRLTAAHRSLPFGTVLRLTNPSNGRSVEVRINDRGPWVGGRELDLSEAAFAKLAPLGAGVIQVSVEIIK